MTILTPRGDVDIPPDERRDLLRLLYTVKTFIEHIAHIFSMRSDDLQRAYQLVNRLSEWIEKLTPPPEGEQDEG